MGANQLLILGVSGPELTADEAVLSTYNIIRRLLRDQLGFDHHLVLTDDLDHDLIRSRYGTPAAARMAVAAGADLVLLRHCFARAAESLAALATLPAPTIDNAIRRLERVRKRLHPPHPFSSATLDEVNATFSDLQARVGGAEPGKSTAKNPGEGC